MKSKSTLIILAVIAFALSACGTKTATPTADYQGTAMAAASTMIAATQAAVPSTTPVPPTAAATETLMPTPTIPPLPTNPVFPSPTAVIASSGNTGGSCNGLITTSKGEPHITVTINNKTKVLLGVSLYLHQNSFGECGFWSSPTGVSASSSVTLTTLPDANSCYHVTAWTLSGKPNFINSGDFCSGASGGKYVIDVTTSSLIIR